MQASVCVCVWKETCSLAFESLTPLFNSSISVSGSLASSAAGLCFCVVCLIIGRHGSEPLLFLSLASPSKPETLQLQHERRTAQMFQKQMLLSVKN